MKEKLKKFMIWFGALAFVLFCGYVFYACTENTRAKRYGGTMTVELPCDQVLTNATWKEDQLWYMYRPARTKSSAPETHIFQEESKYGMVEGKVIFKESKCND